MKENNLNASKKISKMLRFSRDKRLKTIENIEESAIQSKYQLENTLLVTEKITPKIYKIIKKHSIR